MLDRVTGVRTGRHVCRGNWSPDESTLLRGSCQPLRPYPERTTVRQLVLEHATERAGDVVQYAGKELGLEVLNPRTPRIESPDEIQRTVERAVCLYPADQIFLNPDCGFSTFANRSVNEPSIASRKLELLAGVTRDLRPPLGQD